MVNKFLHPNGGSETYIFKLGEQLRLLGHEVEYFGMEHENRIVGNAIGCYTQNMDFHTGKIQKLLYPFKILYSLEAKEKMSMVLEAFQPDVVHLNNINFQLTPSVIDAVSGFERKKKKKIKIVATAHDYQWVCPNHMLMIPSSKRLCFACEGGKYWNCSKNKCIHNSTVKSILGSIEAYFYKARKTYNKIDITICPSGFLNKKLSTNPYFKNKTITMHNFIVEQNKEKSNIDTEIFTKYDIPHKYVIYFGRYSQEKGINTLLKVCRNLKEITFVFAGTGPLEEEINKEKNIINVGFQTGDALQSLIGKALFSVFPSEWYENCPFSVMETQMYGVPVVASDLGGTSELVEDHVTGELYPGGCEQELIERIEKLWKHTEIVDKYKKNCDNTTFATLEQYCKKLLDIYSMEQKAETL